MGLCPPLPRWNVVALSPAPPSTAEVKPLSVSALTAQIKSALEQFPAQWVVGEVSNFSRPQSGHCYFTLKDADAQIRAVIWRGSAAKMKFALRDGLQLVCRGRIDVYGPRGSYQLVVDRAEPQGEGALELALRQLKEKLAAEGLFAPERKRPLPAFPRRIGFVTSPTGAAVRDFLQVLRRRWAGAHVLVVPTRVQGDEASAEIAAAIRLANRVRPRLDALVVGRGGGSLEDLWPFNEEPVVRAIAASKIPTISAVGHEIDVTLADFAADVRALTPSEAAERVAPSADDLTAHTRRLGQRLHDTMRRLIILRAERLQSLRMRRPFARPHTLIEDRSRAVDELGVSASRAMHDLLTARRSELATLAGKVESLSPLGVLERGYSLTLDRKRKPIRSIGALKAGDGVTIRVADGEADCEVTQTRKISDHSD